MTPEQKAALYAQTTIAHLRTWWGDSITEKIYSDFDHQLKLAYLNGLIEGHAAGSTAVLDQFTEGIEAITGAANGRT